MILENIIQKSIEFDLPVWIVSIDLTKAFDRIEHHALFAALSEQGVPVEYQTLLQCLYTAQRGAVDNCHFNIERGVRQGDVLSPMLFNSALESVMRRWKARLRNHGLLPSPEHERLTNLRYADDLLLFAWSLEDATYMLDCLVEELSAAGLSVNAKKTKVMTTDAEIVSDGRPLFIDAGGGMVEVVKHTGTHKYLGRLLSGDLRVRGKCNLEHRSKCAWLKYHHIGSTLQNRNISIKLRLRLFDAVVTPSVLYSLATTPSTQSQLGKLDALQRKMSRRIVGWVRFDEESWQTTGHRMKQRLEAALAQHPITDWSVRRNDLRGSLTQQLENESLSRLCSLSHSWRPGRARRRGRPLQRWTA